MGIVPCVPYLPPKYTWYSTLCPLCPAYVPYLPCVPYVTSRQHASTSNMALLSVTCSSDDKRCLSSYGSHFPTGRKNSKILGQLETFNKRQGSTEHSERLGFLYGEGEGGTPPPLSRGLSGGPLESTFKTTGGPVQLNDQNNRWSCCKFPGPVFP